VPDAFLDRRDFVRTASLAALAFAAACSKGTPRARHSPTPGTGGSGTGGPSPTPSGSARALRWRRIGTAGPKARSHHTLTANADGSIVFLFGGRTKGKIYKDAWAFERSTRLWQPLPYGPAPRYGHSAAFAAGHLVVFGGQAGGGKVFNDAWAFDPVHGAWVQLKAGARHPAARSGASGTTIGSALTISHGAGASRNFDDTWALAGAWTQVTPKSGPRPGARSLHRAVYLPGLTRMLLFGGRSAHGLLEDTWLYDPTVLAWTKLAIPGPPPRAAFAAAATKNAAYLFGGAGARGALKDVWSFDGHTWQTQRPAGTPPRARGGVEGALVSGPGMVVFGGTDGTREFDDFWELELPA
jgi:hypothetical protein